MISSETEYYLVYFESRILPQIQIDKNARFKVISQAFLDDAKAWSDTGEKHASFVANEFAD